MKITKWALGALTTLAMTLICSTAFAQADIDSGMDLRIGLNVPVYWGRV